MTRIADDDVEDARSLSLALADHRPGEQVLVAFEKEGQLTTVSVELFGRRLGGGRTNLGAGMQGGQVANAQGEQGDHGFETGGVFRSDDRGDSWTRVNSLNPRPFYYSQIRVDPNDDRTLYVCGIALHRSVDGGATFDTRVGVGTHPDHHALWIDPEDSDHVLLGNDGGLYRTYDRGQSWDSIDTLPLAQYYNVAVDMSRPYRLAGGLQDNGTWLGPSRVGRRSGIAPTDWLYLNGGDGFRCAFDPTDPDVVYCESQNGVIARLDLRSGERRPVSRPTGDGHRYNWNTPLLLSPHNPDTLLFAGTMVVRSVDRGATHEIISPSLPLTGDGSATALDQSPLDAGVMVAGTDDGALWITRDGGSEWVAAHERLALSRPMYVSDADASHHDPARLYVAIDGHRDDDTTPYLLRSDDHGATFIRLGAGLPDGTVRAIAEDPVDEDLVFVGTEFGCFVSFDRGASFQPFESELPTVPVADLVIHPRDGDLVAATHGRGLFVVDVTPLRGLGAALEEGQPRLCPVRPVVTWASGFDTGTYGARRFRGENPARGVAIHYALPTDAGVVEVELTVRDVVGEEVRTLRGPASAGIHRVTWNLSPGGRAAAGGRGGRTGGPGGGRVVPAGDYAVELRVGDRLFKQPLRIEPDPRS